MQILPEVVVFVRTCRVSVMTMAGKPEPPQNHIQHHQSQQQQQPQQQPNVQNVVVYVSNDNFAAQAYATAVNQQNVAASYPQPQSQQNGNAAVTQSVAPLVAKSLKPPIIKTQDFQPSNGLIGNVSLPQQASFYASTNAPSGIVQTNGFHHSHRAETANIVAVMGGEAGSTSSSGTVVFPRCDSVRSETAESSCSSLSSADSQPDANAVTLVLPPGHHNAVMLNNGIQQSAPQATGNIVLAMTVPPNSNNVIQPSNQPVPVQPVASRGPS
ncbi:hypothetical protein L9F63_008671, partial [Diploptera punctata]